MGAGWRTAEGAWARGGVRPGDPPSPSLSSGPARPEAAPRPATPDGGSLDRGIESLLTAPRRDPHQPPAREPRPTWLAERHWRAHAVLGGRSVRGVTLEGNGRRALWGRQDRQPLPDLLLVAPGEGMRGLSLPGPAAGLAPPLGPTPRPQQGWPRPRAHTTPPAGLAPPLASSPAPPAGLAPPLASSPRPSSRAGPTPRAPCPAPPPYFKVWGRIFFPRRQSASALSMSSCTSSACGDGTSSWLRRGCAARPAPAHLHFVAVEEVNVGLVLLRVLAHEQEH